MDGFWNLTKGFREALRSIGSIHTSWKVKMWKMGSSVAIGATRRRFQRTTEVKYHLAHWVLFLAHWALNPDLTCEFLVFPPYLSTNIPQTKLSLTLAVFHFPRTNFGVPNLNPIINHAIPHQD